MSITLTLPYAPSANRYWGERVIIPKGRSPFVSRYLTPEARSYRERVAWIAKAAGVRRPIPGRVVVSLELYPNRPMDYKTRQRKFGDLWDDTVECIDLDNVRKCVMDALNGIAFEDDSRIFRDHGTRMEPDALGKRVVVTIEPYVRTPTQQIDLPQQMLPEPVDQDPFAMHPL